MYDAFFAFVLDRGCDGFMRMGCISLSNWKLCEDPLRSGPSESDRSLRMLTNAAFITAVFFVFFTYDSARARALVAQRLGG